MSRRQGLHLAHNEAQGGRPPYLHHHFETVQQQYESDKLGMWLFLVTEILLFGGLFCAYAVYRANHPEVFIFAHRYLDKTLGGINTVILICSSFTMAWAVRAAQLGQRRLLIVLLCLTLLGGVGFLSIKGVEYERKWKEGLLWGQQYRPKHTSARGAETGPGAAAESETSQPAAAAGAAAGPPPGAPVKAAPGATAKPPGNPDAPLIKPAARGPQGLARLPGRSGAAPRPALIAEPKNAQLFFAIYFVMTGLHGLHVIAGMVVIFIMILLATRGRFDQGYFTPVDLTGLFWHLVDVIWIFLFPLLYLIH